VVGYVMILVGSWLLTMPDPSGLGEDRYGTARKVIRVTLLIGVGEQLLSLAQIVFVVSPDVHAALTFVGVLASIAGIVGIMAQLQYLGKLALRLPDPELARQAESIKWGFGVTYAIFVVIGAVTELSGRAGAAARAGTLDVMGCVSAIVGLVMLVYFFRYLRLLERLGKAFRAQAGYARQIWGNVPVPAPAATS
jgi:hypothetical protein